MVKLLTENFPWNIEDYAYALVIDGVFSEVVSISLLLFFSLFKKNDLLCGV